MEAPKALAESRGAVPAGAEPVIWSSWIARAADGTWVATPEYAGDCSDGDEQEQPACAAAGAVPVGDHLGNVVDTTSRPIR